MLLSSGKWLGKILGVSSTFPLNQLPSGTRVQGIVLKTEAPSSCLPNIIGLSKSRRKGWVMHAARMRAKRNA
jgi:hypothetical protein